jgi:hypothetical protein
MQATSAEPVKSEVINRLQRIYIKIDTTQQKLSYMDIVSLTRA